MILKSKKQLAKELKESNDLRRLLADHLDEALAELGAIDEGKKLEHEEKASLARKAELMKEALDKKNEEIETLKTALSQLSRAANAMTIRNVIRFGYVDENGNICLQEPKIHIEETIENFVLSVASETEDGRTLKVTPREEKKSD